MNPFYESLEKHFRTQKVNVISRDNIKYQGYIERMDWNNRHIVLVDARKHGEQVGEAHISHAERIEKAEKPDYHIEKLKPAKIKQHPASRRTFEPEKNIEYIKDVQEHGTVKSFPKARRNHEGEITAVDGHKRLWAAETAGVREHPVKIMEMTPLEAYEEFAWKHYPLPDNEDPVMTDEEIVQSIAEMEKRLGEQIYNIYPVQYNVNRIEEQMKTEHEKRMEKLREKYQ